jgi:hypothetical protein
MFRRRTKFAGYLSIILSFLSFISDLKPLILFHKNNDLDQVTDNFVRPFNEPLCMVPVVFYVCLHISLQCVSSQMTFFSQCRLNLWLFGITGSLMHLEQLMNPETVQMLTKYIYKLSVHH